MTPRLYQIAQAFLLLFLVTGFAALLGLNFRGALPIACIPMACNHSSQVDTSQRLLLEVSAAMSELDRNVATSIEAVSDLAIERAIVRARSAECNYEGSLCVVRYYQEEMRRWYRLVSILEASRDTLAIWDAANEVWRNTGQKPEDWGVKVCVPLLDVAERLISALVENRVVVPTGLQEFVARASLLCPLQTTPQDAAVGAGT